MVQKNMKEENHERDRPRAQWKMVPYTFEQQQDIICRIRAEIRNDGKINLLAHNVLLNFSFLIIPRDRRDRTKTFLNCVGIV